MAAISTHGRDSRAWRAPTAEIAGMARSYGRLGGNRTSRVAAVVPEPLGR